MHRYSTAIEKERPQLNDETKQAIAAYRRDPSEANRAALRKQVVNISYDDAVAYCKYLTDRDGGWAVYRLPTEAEWEAAAGHMPKDADFNCGENDGTTPTDAYAKTISACGAVDMWGNVWEWTSTEVGGQRAVKGGAWDSRRTECRTEARGTGREPGRGHVNVEFRVVREDSEARSMRNGDRRSR